MDLNTHSGESLQLSDAVFAVDFNEALIHQVVTAFMAAARSGTKAGKNRAAVSGGGKKPFRQKGTGQARQGTIRSPIMRSGGQTFAASPRDYSQKVNKKMYRGAMRSIFSELLRSDRIVVVDSITLAEPKTKELVAKMAELDMKDVLIVTNELDENVMLASRNLYHVGVATVNDIDPVSLVGYEKVVITTEALKTVEERLA